MVAKKCHCRQMPKVIWRRREELQSFSLFWQWHGQLLFTRSLKMELHWAIGKSIIWCLNLRGQIVLNWVSNVDLYATSIGLSLVWEQCKFQLYKFSSRKATTRKQRRRGGGLRWGCWVGFFFVSVLILPHVRCVCGFNVFLFCWYFAGALQMEGGDSEHWLRGWIGASGDKFSN